MQENNQFGNSGINPEQNNTTGSVSGFDAVNDTSGYTVTPEGGFYTKSGADIVQDEPIVTAPSSDDTPNNFQNTAYNDKPYRPAGGYGYGSPNPTPNSNYYAPQPPKASRKKSKGTRVSILTIIISLVVAVAVGAVSGAAVAFVMGDNNSGTTTIVSPQSSENVNITVDEKTVTSVAQAVAEKAGPSVVGIRTTTSVVNFFGGVSETPGEGSGVIYSSDGYIITNYHVIEGAVSSSASSKIEVYLSGDKETPYPASVVGYHISSDLAVIKINAKNLNAVEMGTSADLAVGQYVVTIGSPGGLEFMGSVTYGIISGLDRVVSSNSSVKLIQTDAAINPGNSGGALLDTSGKLIGINSAKIVSEEYEGMGFAIPVDTVKEKVEKIISRKDDKEPYIGITISERYTADVLDYYGYPAGAVVLSVDEESPAENAGIARGDIITEFGGNKISDYTMLGEYLNDFSPNDKVEVKLYRSGRYYTVNLTIGSNS